MINVAQKVFSTKTGLPVQRRRSPWLFLLGVIVLAPLVLYVAREPLLIALARLLVVNDNPRPADYIVVLGGDPEARPFAAADLYRRGLAPRVLIFEHRTDRVIELGLLPSHDELYRKVLELRGVPEHAIERIPGIVDSLWDEAVSLRRVLTPRKDQAVIIVTSPEHTRRARWALRRVLSGMAVEILMVPAPHLNFDETNWWKHDSGALAYLHEYFKFPFYWMRYVFSNETAPLS